MRLSLNHQDQNLFSWKILLIFTQFLKFFSDFLLVDENDNLQDSSWLKKKSNLDFFISSSLRTMCSSFLSINISIFLNAILSDWEIWVRIYILIIFTDKSSWTSTPTGEMHIASKQYFLFWIMFSKPKMSFSLRMEI